MEAIAVAILGFMGTVLAAWLTAQTSALERRVARLEDRLHDREGKS